MKTIVSIRNRDCIELEWEEKNHDRILIGFRAKGCLEFLKKLDVIRNSIGQKISEIEIPDDSSHSSLLIKRVILECVGDWDPPVPSEDPFCKCRSIEQEKVLSSILEGAHDIKSVSEISSAGSGCGTCQPDIQNCINYILSTKNKKKNQDAA